MKKRAYQRYPIEFQERAVGRMESGERPSHLARELGMARSSLYLWKRKCGGQLRPRPPGGTELEPKERRIRELQGKITELQAVIGRQWLELDFFAAALRRVKEQRERNGASGASRSTPKSATGCRRKADLASSRCVH